LGAKTPVADEARRSNIERENKLEETMASIKKSRNNPPLFGGQIKRDP